MAHLLGERLKGWEVVLCQGVRVLPLPREPAGGLHHTGVASMAPSCACKRSVALVPTATVTELMLLEQLQVVLMVSHQQQRLFPSESWTVLDQDLYPALSLALTG